LCEEIRSSEIAAKISEFYRSIACKEAEIEDPEGGGRIAARERKTNQHGDVIVIVLEKVKKLSTDFERLVGEVSALRSAAARIPREAVQKSVCYLSFSRISN
jgi:hypothetical protein